jgi:hypothetical protein
VGTPIRQGERGKGVNMWNLNAITPETDKTAHYFFAQAYNFKLDEPWVGNMLAKQITEIFMDDMAMVKAQQKTWTWAGAFRDARPGQGVDRDAWHRRPPDPRGAGQGKSRLVAPPAERNYKHSRSRPLRRWRKRCPSAPRSRS